MKYLHLLWRNLMRRKIRTTFTFLSIVVAFFLFGLLMAIQNGFDVGVSMAGQNRLLTIHKVSIIQMLPLRYLAAIQSTPGVRFATHMTWFGGFCRRYAGKIYPDRKLVLPREHAPGEEDVLFFARVMIFELLVDTFNRRMAKDDRLHPLVREINRRHHEDESRHLAFGRLLVEDLWRQNPQFGRWAGVGWEWANLAFLAGGLWMLYLRIFTWHAPVAMLASLGLLAAIFYDGGSSASGGSPLFHLLSGATMLGAFFIVTDPVSGATSTRGRLLFGIGVGILVYVIRAWGGYPDGVAFAVLLMNLAAPTIDYYTRPRTYGHAKAERGLKLGE